MIDWSAASRSGLNFELLAFCACSLVLRYSNSRMTFARTGALFGLSALPIGLLSTLVFRSVEASTSGFVVLAIAALFFSAALIKQEGFDPQKIRARRIRLIRDIFRKR